MIQFWNIAEVHKVSVRISKIIQLSGVKWGVSLKDSNYLHCLNSSSNGSVIPKEASYGCFHELRPLVLCRINESLLDYFTFPAGQVSGCITDSFKVFSHMISSFEQFVLSENPPCLNQYLAQFPDVRR